MMWVDGSWNFQAVSYMVRGRGYARSISDLERIVVGVDPTTGTPVTVKDIGQVTFVPDYRRGVADLDGKGNVVGGVVVMRAGILASIAVVIQIGFAITCMLKGKITTGLVALPVPLVGFVGAIRVAKPSSYWAKRFYSERKMAKASARFGDQYVARHERLRDLFSGGGW